MASTPARASRRVHWWALALGLLISLQACSGAGDRSEAIDRLEQLRTRYTAAYNVGDLTSMGAVYTPDAVRMPYDAPAQQSAAEIIAFYQESFATRAYEPSLSLMADEVLVFGDTAMEYGRYREELRPKSGGTPLLERGKYMILATRSDDGTWRYAASIFNRDAPPSPHPPISRGPS